MKAFPKAAPIFQPPLEVKGKVFFPNLDGLRFIAFFMVFLSHGFGDMISPDSRDGIVQQVVIHGGGFGVSFFFVLSGFLITYLILREIALNGKLDIISFYIRRILRIWPLYFLVIAFGFAFYPLIKSVIGYSAYTETGNVLYYIFFLSNFDVINNGRGYGALSTNITWSVAIEEQFYVLWPLLFFLLRPRYYKFIFPLIIVGSALFRLAQANNGMALYFHTFSVISDMAVGGLMAYCVLHGSRLTNYAAKMNKLLIIAIYIAGIITLLYQEMLFMQNAKVAAVFSRIINTSFFAFIIIEQNYAEKSFFKMKDYRVISNLGKYTYGLYLLHPIAIQLILIIIKRFHIDTSSLSAGFIKAGVAFTLSLIMSIISYHLFEKHFLKIKSRFSHIITAT